MRQTTLVSTALLALLITACASGLAVKDEPGPAYAIQVNNPLPHPMIISYDDGTGSHLLGMVSAGTQGRFVITRPASQNLTITATDESRTETITRAITVRQGELTEVSLSP